MEKCKKISKDEAMKRVEKMSLLSDEDCQKKFDVQPIDYLVANEYVKNGQLCADIYCHACKHEEHIVNYNKFKTYECPVCGNEKLYSSPSRYSYNTHRKTKCSFIEETDNGFEFYLFNVSQVYESNEPNWYKKKPTISYSIYVTGFFDKNTGAFLYDMNSKKLHCNMEQVKTAYHFNDVRKNVDPDKKYLIDEYDAFIVNKKNINDKKKANSKATILKQMRNNYIPNRIENKIFKNTSKDCFAYLYSSENHQYVYRFVCPKCGDAWFETINNSNDNSNEIKKINCPTCMKEYDFYNSHYYSNYAKLHMSIKTVLYENTNLPENDLLIRVFENNYTLDKTTDEITTNIIERQRIFLGKSINVYDIKRDNKSELNPYDRDSWEKSSVRDIEINNLYGYSSNRNITILQSNEEIVEIIKNSCLAHSGMIEAYGLGDKRYKSCSELPSLKYIRTWYKAPYIEIILKANMINMVEDVILGNISFKNNTNLSSVLGVSPYVARVAAKMNFNCQQLYEFSGLYNEDNSFNYEMYKRLSDEHLNISQVLLLKHVYNIGYKNTIEYLQNVYNHQCIEKREALTTWIDYLNMANALKIDLTDKSRKFPSSLKKEHDIAMFAHRSVQIEMDLQQFAHQAEINAFYEYSYKDLICIVPKTPQEVIEEATRQKNCLRSYVERLKSGKTVVVFIRYKATPENTLYTAEVCNGKLIQLKGFQNSNPRNKEINEFVAHWAKAKAITCSY